MGVKERRINTLLSLFSEKEIISVEEIKEKLQINERSVKSYIGFLRSNGIEVVPMNRKYKIVNQQPVAGGLLSNQEFRMMKILQTIAENNGGLVKKDLVDRICISLCDEESISRKTIERALKNCEEKGYIYIDENGRYRVSVQTDTLTFTDDEEIFKFMELCEVYKEHIPFYSEVSRLKAKITEQVDYVETDSNVHCLGRSYNIGQISKDIINQFEVLDYRKKVLEISYCSKIGNLTVNIQVMTLLYNWEKDKSYVIGLVDGSISFIDISTIFTARKTEIENCFYNNKAVLDKLDLMFGASIDGPYKVKVQFDNIFNISEKINRLHKHRTSSTLAVSEDKLIYTDTIYGIYDFARYLRGYGSSCKVLEPQELRDVMKKTYERILSMYGGFSDE